MPRTDEAEWWFNAVYEAVQEIPAGQVTTYGHIARLLGHPRRSRQVGICLKHLPSYRRSSNDSDETRGEEVYHHFHDDNVPWQRVVNFKGMISHRGPGSAARQAAALRHEDVRVHEDAMGDFHIDMGRYGWFPENLPSEEGLTEDESDEEGEEEKEGRQ